MEIQTSILAPAKINLIFKILGVYKDNYHKIQSLITPISLFDNIYIKILNEPKLIIEFINQDICPINNTIYKAVKLFIKNIDIGLYIKVYKNIPICSGLGGGSSDAAAVLLALNKILNLNYSYSDLRKIAFKIGADVPFFINPGLSWIYKRGEKCKNLALKLPFYFLLVQPNFGISTKWAYDKYREIKKYSKPIEENIVIKILQNKEYSKLREIFTNDLEQVAITEYPEIKNIKQKLLDFQALTSFMTGSGSCVVGVFLNKPLEAYNYFKQNTNDIKFVYIAQDVEYVA